MKHTKDYFELSESVCCKKDFTFCLKDYICNYYQGNDNRFKGVFVQNTTYKIKPYSLCKYLVTQRLFESVMGYNPSSFSDIKTEIFEKESLRPVENVSWYDCVLFCNKLTKKQFGKDYCVYTISNEEFDEKGHLISASVKSDTTKCGYRLPSEMEWEFAARGGNADAPDFFFAYSGIKQKENVEIYFKANDSEITTGSPKQDKNLDKVAWYSSMSKSFVKRAIFKILRLLTKKNYNISGIHQVGKKKPNRLGLYDMSGNVWEWCYDETDLPPVHEAAEIKERIMRGGGWPNFAYDCCISERYSLPPEWYQKEGFSDVGFRLCRSL